MKKFILNLAGTSFLKAVLQVTSGTVIGQLLILVTLPVITRLYAPEAFGLFGVFNAITGILLVISSLRFELAIPMASNDRNAEQIFSLAILFSVITAITVLISALFFSELLSKWLNTESFDQLIWLMPVALVTGGIFKAFNYMYVWRAGYKKISQSKVVQSLVFVLSQVAFGLAGLSAIGLALGLILGQLGGAIWLGRGISLLNIFGVLLKSPLRTVSLIRKNKNYAKYDVAAAFINAISQHIPSLLLAMLFSPKLAGLYYLAERLLSVPAGVLGRAVGQVLHGHIRNDKNTNFLEVRVHKICLALTLLMFMPTYFIHYHAPSVFQIFFGDSWGASGEIASWLVLGIAVQFIYTPLSIVLITTDGQHKNLGIHVFLLITKVLGLLVGYLTDDFIFAIQCLVFGQVLGYGLALTLTVRHTRMINNTCLPVS
jgi:O-antigen/teichoic acid export membrane protein